MLMLLGTNLATASAELMITKRQRTPSPVVSALIIAISIKFTIERHTASFKPLFVGSLFCSDKSLSEYSVRFSPVNKKQPKTNVASSGLHALAQYYQTCLTNIVRSLPCHGLARLNIRAKRAHVIFIIHLDKLGHLCTNCSEWFGLLECSCF